MIEKRRTIRLSVVPEGFRVFWQRHNARGGFRTVVETGEQIFDTADEAEEYIRLLEDEDDEE